MKPDKPDFEKILRGRINVEQGEIRIDFDKELKAGFYDLVLDLMKSAYNMAVDTIANAPHDLEYDDEDCLKVSTILKNKID